MKEDQFESLMRDAAHTYRKPPEPDLDGMWEAIERDAFGVVRTTRVERSFVDRYRWIAAAAVLVIGIGIGRASLVFNSAKPAQPATAVATVPQAVTQVARIDSSMSRPYEVETSQYLGQTAALLVSLPSEVKGGKADAQFVSRAGDLLTRTRLLMDSPAADDPSMRNLLEDLELVLVQIVRLQNGNRTDLDIINRALEQREVIPRLRTAVADISAN